MLTKLRIYKKIVYKYLHKIPNYVNKIMLVLSAQKQGK